MDDDNTIGGRLRGLRMWRHMTLAEVAGLAGMAPSYLSMVERGVRPLDRRSVISALAVALRVSETDIAGGPHLGADPLQSGPHAHIPGLREALALNTIGGPVTSHARPLAVVTAELAALRGAHARSDYLRLGSALPHLLDELYWHASQPAGEDALKLAAGALVGACNWAAGMAHSLSYPDLAQLASRASLAAADSAGDPVLQGKARFLLIGTAPRATPGAWDTLLAAAERAAASLEPHARSEHSLHVLGLLTLRCALAATAARQDAAAKHWLAEASAIAGRVPDDPERNWEYFGVTNVAIWSVALAVERGETGGAILEAARAVDQSKLTVMSRRAYLCLDVSRGLARDPKSRGEAVRWMAEALAAAPQQVSNYGPARATVAYLLERARSAAGGRELRGMAARMGVPHAITVRQLISQTVK
jgi:transcriptional regulator with XRE-family HTH domain